MSNGPAGRPCGPEGAVRRRSVRAFALVAIALGSLGPLAWPGDAAAQSQPGAEQVLFPEYPTCEDKSQQLAAHVIGWLTNPEQREALVARLAELKARVCHAGAAGNAAEYVLRTLHAGARTSARRAA